MVRVAAIVGGRRWVVYRPLSVSLGSETGRADLGVRAMEEAHIDTVSDLGG